MPLSLLSFCFGVAVYAVSLYLAIFHATQLAHRLPLAAVGMVGLALVVVGWYKFLMRGNGR